MVEPHVVALEQRVLEVVARVLTISAEQLRAEPSLSAHGWTSLAAMETFVALEEEFRAILDMSALARARSIEDLVKLVIDAGADG
ncbi:acyl carrier protein [Streptomyces tanashiensis]|uniref:acyl carrier protein n=1 Tax=Streptomyces tanashiensis TaxID=67367 RepID=UPI0033F0E90F